ncbi:MAG: asparaginase [Chlorobium sp.]
MSTPSKVFILYTGGTIGMAPSDTSNSASPLVPQPLEELIKWIPGWKNGVVVKDEKNKRKIKSITLVEGISKGISLGFDHFEKPLDSSNITPENWQVMAERIERVYNDYDGFVILHGTDTMAYTASALAFLFENLAKPVVITGSQLQISHERTDGVMNLVNAVHIAGWKTTGLPCIPEVVVCFADKLLRGCRTSKVSSTAWAGFDSPNFPHLGSIGEHIKINEELLLPIPDAKQSFHVIKDINTNVIDIALNPGMKAAQLRAIMDLPDVDAIILRTFGAGNAPDRPSFLQVIQEITFSKKTIVNVTQCQQGMVEMGLYESSAGLLERGVISGMDMTPEAALTKLYVTLANKVGIQRALQMQVSQRGEQTENLFDLRYGVCGDSEDPKAMFDDYQISGRFDVKRLSKAVVRFQGIGIAGSETGKSVLIRIFINKPASKSDTPADDPSCIAKFMINADGKEHNVVQVVPDTSSGYIRDGEITLSVRADEGVKFWFKGLYLALFAKA